MSNTNKLNNMELELVKNWEENRIFDKTLENKGKTFTFYDGPPFATGDPHYGHILAGMIKDAIARWKTINGYSVPRRAGWDCHGLPIEYKIEELLKIKTKEQILQFGIGNYNEECRKIVMSCAGQWKIMMSRLGRWVDFDNDYKTMDLDYMSKVWSVFSKIYEKGLVYEGVKIMPYSPACTTPLSNFEAGSNYVDVVDRTVIVKFPLCLMENTYFLSWTTTPWTLPAHYCLCVNMDIIYVLIEHMNEQYYIAKTQLNYLKEKLKVKDFKEIKETKGSELVGIKYTPPYNYVLKDTYSVVQDSFVSSDSGTGIVHIAPAFGNDDYNVCIKNNLITKELSSLFQHIDDNGNSINCGDFSGVPFKQLNKMILKDIGNKNLSLVVYDYQHSYPYCWRSDTPLIYKAVNCWFVNVEKIKDQMCELNKTINWVPEDVGSKRFGNWLENAKDWCISRNRYWGTPIPIWKSDNGDILIIKSKEHLEELTNKKYDDIHRHNIDNENINISGIVYKRVETVFDCWFESGCVPFASNPSDYPADFIAEGLDQTRGWFYTLLVIGTIITDKAPFKNVIVNGLVLASDGKKMSKRLSNYPNPNEVISMYGADSLRYYLLMSGASMGLELRFNNNDLKEVLQTIIIPLTNSLSFFNENYKLYCLNKKFKFVESNRPFDKWIKKKLYGFITKYTFLLNSYKINPIHDLLLQFINDLNNNYIRMNRDVMKGKDEDDVDNIKCLQSLNTLHYVLHTLSIYLSPVLPFLTEKIYQELKIEKKESVHLTNIQDIVIENPDENDMIDVMLNIVNMIRKIRNTSNIQMKRPLLDITIYCDIEKQLILQNVTQYIASECNVIDINYKLWEATKYKYTYNINTKNAGKLLRDKRNEFENFMKTLPQNELESVYIDKKPIQFHNFNITSDLVTVLQIIEDTSDDNFKIEEDIFNRIKIKVNIESNNEIEELYIAKNIATKFQNLRKIGEYHSYDTLKLVMCDNMYTKIVLKHMEYIKKITRVPIEIVSTKLSSYDNHKCFELNSCNMDLYLIKV